MKESITKCALVFVFALVMSAAFHAAAAGDAAIPETAKQALPKLVDLGATKCIPCKKMAPILEQLKKDYAGKLEVVFIDVWEKKDEAEKYKISLIPTQIFFDASGKERFRHEGFYSREDILAKWKELGVDLAAPVKAGK
jgi:thioredoxin 1